MKLYHIQTRLLAYGALKISTLTSLITLLDQSLLKDTQGTFSPLFFNYFSNNTQNNQLDNDRSSSNDTSTENKTQNHSKVHRIVLTGGPCSGKTIGTRFIAEKLRQRGIIAYCVPESATIIADGGGFINSFQLNKEEQVKLQSVISQLTLDLENRFFQLASSKSSHTVMLCDRGIMDGKGYCEPDVWETLIKQKGWNIDEMRDNRYDAVLHMVTSADGCCHNYSNVNNRMRFETVQQALYVDKKLQEAWNKHPNFYILDNRYDFERKLDDALKIVCKVIEIDY